MMATIGRRISKVSSAALRFKSLNGGWFRGAWRATTGSFRMIHQDGVGAWLHKMRSYIARGEGRLLEAAVSTASDPADYKQMLTRLGQMALEVFLATRSRIRFPEHQRPRLSIVLVLYNRCELTLQCLRSLLEHQRTPFEVIVVDNNSTDSTRDLLDRLDGVKIIRNSTNVGFVKAVNQGGELARGDYLLLLNNDTQVLGNSLEVAVRELDADPDIGALGGKLILPGGELQEAGSIIWSDGSCQGYGRGQDPFLSEFMFKRDVDYCSGAFLLTRRELFHQLGALDEIYSPAYYEEVDYCIKVHKSGYRIVYHPDVVILHYEFASSQSSGAAMELMQRNHQVLIERHLGWLEEQHHRETASLYAARQRSGNRRKVLYLDDRVPYPWLGQGYPRSRCLMEEFVAQGNFVTFYPMFPFEENWSEIYNTCPAEVEIALMNGSQDLAGFLASRAGDYDVIWVSRPHNMQVLKDVLPHTCIDASKLEIIYDAEAIFALRTARQQQLAGKPLSPETALAQVQKEVSLAEGSRCISCVSPSEMRHFSDNGYKKVFRLGHVVHLAVGDSGFSQRDKLLFVGAFSDLDTPNADSVRWLAEEIVPELEALGLEPGRVMIAGTTPFDLASIWPNPHINYAGRVHDLATMYHQSRVFLAPTRYSAGVPLKIYEAAAHGLPIVATSLLTDQLGWKPEVELLIADSAQEFAAQAMRVYRDEALWRKLQAGAIAAVERDCSPDVFARNLHMILESRCKTSVGPSRMIKAA